MNIEEVFFLFLSCEKYKNKREKSKRNRIKYDYRYFIGDDKIKGEVEEDVVVLECKDNYESLTSKTIKAIKWISKNKPNIKYVVKTDDDVEINKEKLDEVLLKLEQNSIDYAGEICRGGYYSKWHFDKCDDPYLNTSLMPVPNILYCMGAGYFLSKKSIDLIANIDSYENYYSIYEDATIGNILKSNNIIPIGVDIKKIFKWDPC